MIFSPPDFSRDVDAEAHLAIAPQDEVSKGMFLIGVLDEIKRVCPGREGEALEGVGLAQIAPFDDVPIASKMRLMLNGAKILHPRLPSREGLRRLGWLAYPSMTGQYVGKVVFERPREDPDKVMEAGARACAVSLKHGRARAHKVADNHWRYEWEKIYGFLDTYYVGIVEGALRAQGVLPKVRVQLRSIVDGDFDVTWV